MAKRGPTQAVAEMVAVESLVPWSGNPRRISDESVERVARSIERFGFAAPIVARRVDRTIIAGHTRWQAARKLGLAEVPVRFMDLDPSDAHLLAIFDNRSNELAEWDYEKLAAELRELPEVDRTLSGFDEHELEPLLAADWTPPPVGEMPTRGETKKSTSLELELDADERATVDRAVAVARGRWGDSTEGTAVARALGDWLTAGGAAAG